MTLQYEQFEICALEFVALASSIGDQWMVKRTDSRKKDLYLEKRCMLHKSKDQNSENNINTTKSQSLFSSFVYHIVYSESYTVPVLYFNAYHADGKLLTLDEIWNEIPDCYQSSVKENKWNMITQQEHPKLGIPYFMIHPCHTANFMSCCHSQNYLVTWLSTVGPLVGLHLSFEYAKLNTHT